MVQMYLCRLLNDVYSFLLSSNHKKKSKNIHCYLNAFEMYFIVFLYTYFVRNAINSRRRRIFTFVLDSFILHRDTRRSYEYAMRFYCFRLPTILFVKQNSRLTTLYVKKKKQFFMVVF